MHTAQSEEYNAWIYNVLDDIKKLLCFLNLREKADNKITSSNMK